MTVETAFAQLQQDLSPRYGAGEARSIARIVFEDVFHSRRRIEPVLTPEEMIRFEEIRQRLLAGEPVQYVLGEADFFGLKFLVNPSVLIPRQETEELVAWVLEWLNFERPTLPAVLDIGLGSGCIGVTLKRKLPGLRLFGLEKSPEALAVATQNARRILADAAFTFVLGDILDTGAEAFFPALDVIVSNPPYIPLREQNQMPEHVLAHEPALALFVDDADPLVFYRAITRFAMQKLKPGGCLFFECNEFNAQEVAGLLEFYGFTGIELRNDLNGAERMVSGVYLHLPAHSAA